MSANLIPILYTVVFAILLVILIPREEIRRLSIYGIIFGGIFDIFVVGIANFFGEFRYINYEPFGLMGLHFMAPISWSIFFILYFHFLPRETVYVYIYTVMGIFYSMMFCQMITKLGVLSLARGIVDSIAPFVPWFTIATWGYIRLREREERIESRHETEQEHGSSLVPGWQPLAKPLPKGDYDEKGGRVK
ncbi:putative membrane protein [Propionispora sp. 2/2-37]|uniref:hypothetical protein n=1 Tax=Propionispora sp. 2/2-37 TaxID=1677858 RepID=UPI0006C1442C|nr:hypothetical protein [Propionispora sp. 2/2-37]CUH94735.1 putative membrane protein [Propionispora sp. 2/2-37]